MDDQGLAVIEHFSKNKECWFGWLGVCVLEILGKEIHEFKPFNPHFETKQGTRKPL